MMAGDAPRLPLGWVRYAAWICVVVAVAAFYSPRRDFDLLSAASIAALILFAIALPHVEKTPRPLKNYLRAGLGVAALALVLIAMPLLMGAELWLGLILWAGLSTALLAWVYFYERTEPR
ncbi:hypothetical protein [Sphingopyxis witflariensis]|uniref:hypothetical protein n=1 Tax=Sphingopyxis witflariensis TaxID=173675 RepID=UPI00118188D1|nr:hypothetical protein [Sphingopyxis witflariensis]